MKARFQKYYPELELSGGLRAKKEVENQIVSPASPPMILFSGGVDATFSLWSNRALRPNLVSVRGADIYFTQSEDRAWREICQQHSEIALAVALHLVRIA